MDVSFNNLSGPDDCMRETYYSPYLPQDHIHYRSMEVMIHCISIWIMSTVMEVRAC